MATTQRSTKDEMIEVIRQQPDDSSYDEILRELAFSRMIQRGLEDVAAGRTITRDEMKRIVTSRQP